MVLKNPPPPSMMLWAAELPRAAWSVVSWPRHRASLAGAPRGDGATVMLLPGLFNSDRANFVMRRYLTRLGYRVEGWGLGRNLGARTVGTDAGRLIERLDRLCAETGPIALVGVSLGGVIARLIAHERPDLVRAVVTISAPFAGLGRSTNLWRVFELMTGERIDDPALIERCARIATPLPVPATAIWSASDGLVAGDICRTDACRSIEINSSHLGVHIKPETLLAIARALAEP